jgi:hypothetical protein
MMNVLNKLTSLPRITVQFLKKTKNYSSICCQISFNPFHVFYVFLDAR